MLIANSILLSDKHVFQYLVLWNKNTSRFGDIKLTNSLIIQWVNTNPTSRLVPAENFWGYLELAELKYTKILPYITACC